MRRFTAYIFDLDGVLCHTDKFHFAAWAALAKKLDLPFDASVNDRLRGVSRMESLDIVLGEKKDAFTAEQKTLFAKEKNAIYRGYLQTMTPADLDEDVRSTLLKLRADGHKLAVGSSSKNAPLILERIGLGSFFDAVADGTQITHSKPDPEVFLLAAKLLSVKPDDASLWRTLKLAYRLQRPAVSTLWPSAQRQIPPTQTSACKSFPIC